MSFRPRPQRPGLDTRTHLLRRGAPITGRELADELGISPQAAAMRLARLERARFVRREFAPRGSRTCFQFVVIEGHR